MFGIFNRVIEFGRTAAPATMAKAEATLVADEILDSNNNPIDQTKQPISMKKLTYLAVVIGLALTCIVKVCMVIAPFITWLIALLTPAATAAGALGIFGTILGLIWTAFVWIVSVVASIVLAYISAVFYLIAMLVSVCIVVAVIESLTGQPLFNAPQAPRAA